MVGCDDGCPETIEQHPDDPTLTYKLPDVCNHLGIEPRHHQADSDAEACARIVRAAQAGGWRHES